MKRLNESGQLMEPLRQRELQEPVELKQPAQLEQPEQLMSPSVELQEPVKLTEDITQLRQAIALEDPKTELMQPTILQEPVKLNRPVELRVEGTTFAQQVAVIRKIGKERGLAAGWQVTKGYVAANAKHGLKKLFGIK